MPNADANNIKLAIIGAGNMGQSCAAAVSKTFASNAQITFISSREINPETKIKFPAAKFEVSLPEDLDLLILAVKPKDFFSLASYNLESLDARTVVLSTMAGVKVEQLKKIFQKSPIVRVMSNLGIKEGRGIVAYFISEKLVESQQALMQALLESFGNCIRLDSETMLDPATALIGSFPAVLIKNLEIAVRYAETAGFEKDDAKDFLLKVAQSTMHQLLAGSATLSEEIAKIASKGGTTEALLSELGEDFETLLTNGLQAATKKAQDLGKLA